MDDLISESHVAPDWSTCGKWRNLQLEFASFSFQERFSGMSLKSFGMWLGLFNTCVALRRVSPSMDPPMLCWDLGHPACRAAAWHRGEPRNEKMEGKDLDDMKIMQHQYEEIWKNKWDAATHVACRNTSKHILAIFFFNFFDQLRFLSSPDPWSSWTLHSPTSCRWALMGNTRNNIRRTLAISMVSGWSSWCFWLDSDVSTSPRISLPYFNIEEEGAETNAAPQAPSRPA